MPRLSSRLGAAGVYQSMRLRTVGSDLVERIVGIGGGSHPDDTSYRATASSAR